MVTFRDHFSAQSPLYAQYRPRYPAALYSWLATLAPSRHRAWDCGTGNGQAASALLEHFGVVVASDASTSQLAQSHRDPGPAYAAMTAESAALASGSMALVTVAQALHWFNTDDFFAEAMRVLEPEGVLAVWSYGLLTITPAIDAVIGRINKTTLGDYWPPERAHVDDCYASLVLPMKSIAPPDFVMEEWWPLSRVLGYLRTWSAVLRLSSVAGIDPVEALTPELTRLRGDVEEARLIRWPLATRAGRK